MLFDFVEFNLSFHGQLIGNSFGILHLFCKLDSIFFPFSGFFLLSFFPYLSGLLGQLFEFSLCLFGRQIWLIVGLSLKPQFLLEIWVILMLLNPFLCTFDTDVTWVKINTYQSREELFLIHFLSFLLPSMHLSCLFWSIFRCFDLHLEARFRPCFMTKIDCL